jgi:ribonuclease HI
MDRTIYAAGFATHTTNQRMEVQAALEAIKAHPEGALEIVSDSTYVVNCFKDRWHMGWRRRGWRNSQGQAVANRDLWEELFSVTIDIDRDVTFRWVKGHSGDSMNDWVDELATAAADRQANRFSGGASRDTN